MNYRPLTPPTVVFEMQVNDLRTTLVVVKHPIKSLSILQCVQVLIADQVTLGPASLAVFAN